MTKLEYKLIAANKITIEMATATRRQEPKNRSIVVHPSNVIFNMTVKKKL